MHGGAENERALPHAAVLEPLVIYGLLLETTEREKWCKRLRPSDFLDDYLGGLFTRIKAGKLDLDRLLPKERRRLIEEVIKPGAWQYYRGNLWWHVELIREAAIDRGRILAAEKKLAEAWSRVKRRNLKFETDRESTRP